MELKVIAYQSSEYDEMVALRYSILREPLGLVFTEMDLLKDADDLLLVARSSDDNRITGCCILTVIDKDTVQLRQMAVASSMQGKGVGSRLLLFAESVAKERHFGYICLHARKVAIGFYKKHDYIIVSDEFTEVGIAHFEMLKQLK